jgi:hypothetical protein
MRKLSHEPGRPGIPPNETTSTVRELDRVLHDLHELSLTPSHRDMIDRLIIEAKVAVVDAEPASIDLVAGELFAFVAWARRAGPGDTLGQLVDDVVGQVATPVIP